LVVLDQRAYAEEFLEAEGMLSASPYVIPMSKSYVASLVKTGELLDEPQPHGTSSNPLTKFTETVGKAA
jgi:hypothetical protein